MSNFKPEGFQCITPYLVLKNLGSFVDFANKALGAEIISKMGEGSEIQHAELKLNDSMIMAGESKENQPMPAMLYYYVKDCDNAYKVAMEHGCESVQVPEDMPYGDRNAAVKDSWGNQWWFATHKQ